MAQDTLSVSRRSLDIEDYIDIIRRHKGWIFGPTFALLVAAVVVAFLWPDTYLSTAVIRVVPPQVPENYIAPNITTDMQGRINSLSQMILNRSSLTALVNKYQLYRKELSRLPMEDVIENMKQRDVKIYPVQTFGQSGQGKQPVPAFMIGFQYNNRLIAQKVANDLMNNFIEESNRATGEEVFGTTDLLKKQLEDARAKRDECNQKLQTYRVKNLGHLPDQQQGNYAQLNALQGQMINLDASMSRTQSDKLNLDNEMRIMRQQLQQLKDPNADQVVIDQKNERLALKDKEIEHMESYLARLRERYTDANPDVQATVDQINLLKKQRETIAKEDQSNKPEARPLPPNPQFVRDQRNLQVAIQRIGALQEQKDLEMKELQKQQAQLRETMRSIQGRIEAAPLGSKEFSELNSDLEVAERQYQEAEEKFNRSSRASDVNKRNQGERLAILDPASTPQTPTEPKRPIIIAAGAAIGLVLGLILAGAREMKNTSVKNLKDVRAYTQLPVLGSIPLLENDLVVRRRRRLAWLAWSTACLVGGVIGLSSVLYYVNTRV
jgi:succinoglycan biosynthesis transport protein ExoP